MRAKVSRKGTTSRFCKKTIFIKVKFRQISFVRTVIYLYNETKYYTVDLRPNTFYSRVVWLKTQSSSVPAKNKSERNIRMVRKATIFPKNLTLFDESEQPLSAVIYCAIN